jgi:hypothetical protein
MQARRLIGLALAFLGLGASAARGIDAGRGPLDPRRPSMELYWSDREALERTLRPGDRIAAEKEVVAIYEAVGIAVRFPPSPSAVAAVEAVETVGEAEPDARAAFHIVLIERSGAGFRLPAGAMGAILEKDPARRTVFVFLPVIQRALGYPVDGKTQNAKLIHDARKGRVLARALGRVVAHEIAHAIDSDLPHGPADTVMCANLTGQMLRRDRLELDVAAGERLRERIARIRSGDPR